MKECRCPENESEETFSCTGCKKTFCSNCYVKYTDYESNCCYEFTLLYCFSCYLSELGSELQYKVDEIADTINREIKILKELKERKEN